MDDVVTGSRDPSTSTGRNKTTHQASDAPSRAIEPIWPFLTSDEPATPESTTKSCQTHTGVPRGHRWDLAARAIVAEASHSTDQDHLAAALGRVERGYVEVASPAGDATNNRLRASDGYGAAGTPTNPYEGELAVSFTLEYLAWHVYAQTTRHTDVWATARAPPALSEHIRRPPWSALTTPDYATTGSRAC